MLSVHQEHEFLLKMEQAGLGSDEAQSVIESPDNKLAGQIVVNIRSDYLSNRLLEPVSSSNVPAIKEFVAKDYFKVGETDGVKIAYLDNDFIQNFLDKTEHNVQAASLKVFRLKKDSFGRQIIIALGRKHKTALAHLWELLKAQPKGEAGVLLTNGYANIFYIRNTDNILWAVRVRWGGDGWYVCAPSVEYPFRSDAGSQVFGR
ncbi:MAG TPA: hypothetical protein VJA28_00985 [Patescibacteria group bacterium]|nr:hypothetical protein [Patescibacteria group bacterium]